MILVLAPRSVDGLFVIILFRWCKAIFVDSFSVCFIVLKKNLSPLVLCVCVCMCLCMCVCVCMHECMCVCACMHVCAFFQSFLKDGPLLNRKNTASIGVRIVVEDSQDTDPLFVQSDYNFELTEGLQRVDIAIFKQKYKMMLCCL